MRKPDFCICKNKDADQLCSNCTADQCLCLHYTDNTIPLLHKSEISSFKPVSVVVQAGLCRTWSEPPKTVFSCRGSFSNLHRNVCELSGFIKENTITCRYM